MIFFAWFGLVVPANTSPMVVQRLNQAANAALQQTQVREHLSKLGVEPMGGTPQDLEIMVKQTSKHVQQLVQARGISDGL